MRILVTGGAGFIGSHIVDRCVADGHEVTILDNLSNSTLSNLEEYTKERAVDFLKCDIRDLRVVKKFMRGVDAVFHEAAQVSVPLSMEDPVYVDDVNVRGTLNLLIAASEEEVERFIYASSSSVYGDPLSLPVAEDSPLRPLSPYAASKLAGEVYCTAFQNAKGLPIVSLRYFNVYGPRQRLDGYASVIPSFIRGLLEHKPMTIFGDGSQTRDFVHVRDVVEANILALTVDRAVGEAFNIGSGESTSVTELSNILREVSNVKTAPPIHASPRRGDVKHSTADITKTEKILGYKPRTNLRLDLKSLFESYRKRFKGVDR